MKSVGYTDERAITLMRDTTSIGQLICMALCNRSESRKVAWLLLPVGSSDNLGLSATLTVLLESSLSIYNVN
jgi:hypothetical protein